MSDTKKTIGKQINSMPKEPVEKRDLLASDIGKRLQNARNGLAWSQESLHKRTTFVDPEGLGISRAVLSIYERGASKPGAREIKLLCEALKITPNWLLYGSDSPSKTLQASLDFLQGNDFQVSVRLAFAMMALERAERDHFAGLLFAIVNQRLGDLRLSGLMSMANTVTEDLLGEIAKMYGDEIKGMPLKEIMSKFVQDSADSGFSNKGHLRPMERDGDYNSIEDIPPSRKLDGQD